MTDLSYTRSLIANTPENIDDVSTMFNETKAYVNSAGWVDANRLASSAVTTAKINSGAVTETKIADDAVTDQKLAAPNNDVYRTVRSGRAGYVGSLSNGQTYVPTSGGYSAGGGSLVTLFSLAAADYDVATLTTKLNLRIDVALNATALGSAVVTYGLYPITPSGGGSGNLLWSLGTVVAGSTVALTNSDGSSTGASKASGDFTIPADGRYVVAAAISGASVPAGAHADGTFGLFMRHV